MQRPYGWGIAHVWAHGRGPALGIVAVQILLGLQPALLIYITQHLIDTVVASAGEGGAGFEQTLPWLLSFGLVLLLSSDVQWQIRDALYLRLEQNLEHALGRRFLAKSSRLPLVFFEVSAFYDRLERAKNPGRTVDRFFFEVMHTFQAGIRVISIAAMFASVSLWISLTLLIVLVPQIRMSIEQSRRFMSFTYGQTEAMRRVSYVDRILTGRGEQKEKRLFALHQTLSQRWRAMRQALREQLWRQQKQQVRGRLPGTCLRFAVSAGVAVALTYFLGDRLLTPGRFVALFRGVDDMLEAGFSLGYHSMTLQNQNAEISYVREFLDLPEDDGAWIQRPPADREPTRLFPKPLREGFAVKDVWFAYPAADATGTKNPRPVLRGVSLHLERGDGGPPAYHEYALVLSEVDDPDRPRYSIVLLVLQFATGLLPAASIWVMRALFDLSLAVYEGHLPVADLLVWIALWVVLALTHVVFRVGASLLAGGRPALSAETLAVSGQYLASGFQPDRSSRRHWLVGLGRG